MQVFFLFDSENLKKEERLRFVLDDKTLVWFDEREEVGTHISFYIPANKDALKKFITLQEYEGVSFHFMPRFEPYVQERLEKSYLQALSLAKKANLLVVGLPQIKEYKVKKSFKAFILASDAGKDVSKRVHSWKSVICHGVTSLELGNALGLNNVSVVGVKDKKEANYLINTHKKFKALTDNEVDV